MHPNGEPRVAAWVKTAPERPLVPVGEGLPPDRLAGASWVWVDVTAPTTEIALELGERFRLPDHIVEDAIDPGVFPKWEDHDERLLVVVHVPAAGDDQLDTMPVVCLVGADLLLTFRPASHAGLDWLAEAVTTHAVLAEGGPDRMLGRLVEFAAREFLPLVEELDVAFDALADRALQGDPAVLPDTQALRRDAATLRSVLGPSGRWPSTWRRRRRDCSTRRPGASCGTPTTATTASSKSSTPPGCCWPRWPTPTAPRWPNAPTTS